MSSSSSGWPMVILRRRFWWCCRGRLNRRRRHHHHHDMMMMRVNEKLSFFLRRQRDKVFSASSRRRGLFFFVFCFRPLFISGKSGHMMCLFIFLSHHRSRFSLLKTSKFKSQDIFIIKKQSLLSSKNHPPRPHQVFYTHNNNTSYHRHARKNSHISSSQCVPFDD